MRTSVPIKKLIRAASLLRASEAAKDIIETFGIRVGMLGIGLISSIVVTRALGPAGRGEFAFAAALAGLIAQFGNFGLHAANTYYGSKSPTLLPGLLSNSLWVSLTVGLITAAGLATARLVAHVSLPVSGAMLVLVAASVPLGIGIVLLQQLYLAVGRVRFFNATEVAQRVTTVAASLAIVAAGWQSPELLFAVTVLASLGVLGWMYAQLPIQRVRKPDWPAFQLSLNYGLRAYFAALAGYVVLRIDILLVGAIAGPAATGQYSVVVALADFVGLFSIVTGALLFPRMSAQVDAARRWRTARQATTSVAGIMLVIAGLAAVTAAPMIKLLYGAPFLDATQSFRLLLPGLVFLGVNAVLMNYLAALGMPPITIISPLTASTVNIIANVVLIPRWGINGAAVASTIAYALMLAFSIAYCASERHRRLLVAQSPGGPPD